jgi:hypothetical protein
MLAGRPHETAGNGSPRWMTAAPRQREAQNPAYRPAHPHHMAVACGGAVLRQSPGAFGAHARTSERPVERVTGPAAGRRHQVAIQVNGGRDGLMAEPAGHLGDRNAFGKTGRERFTNHAEWAGVTTGRWRHLPSSLRFSVSSVTACLRLMQQDWAQHPAISCNTVLLRCPGLWVRPFVAIAVPSSLDRFPYGVVLASGAECCIRRNSAPLRRTGEGVPQIVKRRV